MKPTKIIIILFFVTSTALAQKKNVNISFFKNNGTYVQIRDSADYIRVVKEPDPGSKLYNMSEFYTNGKRRLVGKSITVNSLHFEGQCIQFNKNGGKQSLVSYKNGYKVGLEYLFYPNGNIYSVKEYPDTKEHSENVTDSFLINAEYDSLGTVIFKNGNGYFKGYDDDFKYINEEGKIKNGKRDSIWKGQFKDYDAVFTENYQNGNLVTGTAIDKNGHSTTYKKSRGGLPGFAGGVEGFYRYLSRNVHYPQYERDSDIQGTVFLSFVIEKDGKINDIVVIGLLSPGIDDEAVRVLKESPLWVPATIFGKPIRVSYSMPLVFSLSQ